MYFKFCALLICIFLLPLSVTTQSCTGPLNISQSPTLIDDIPEIYGDNVIWYSREPTDVNQQIKLYSISNALPPINIPAAVGSVAPLPKIWGDYVVFEGSSTLPGFSNEIYLYSISLGGSAQIISSAISNSSVPHIHGDYVAWQTGYANSSIFLYSISNGGSAMQISTGTNNRYPYVHGDYVIWISNFNTLMLYTISSGGPPIPIYTNNLLGIFPRIDGNHIIWRSGGDLFLYDIITGNTPINIAQNVGDHLGTADIEGDYVVYTADNGIDTEVYAYSISQNVTQNISQRNGAEGAAPSISGDNVVWGGPGANNIDTWVYSLSGGGAAKNISSTISNDDYVVNIHGDNIVFSNTNNTNDIYLNTLLPSNCPTGFSDFAKLTGSILGLVLDYETDGRIQSSQNITGGIVDYDSGDYILLDNDFTIYSSCTFNAFIDGCNGSGGVVNPIVNHIPVTK